MCGIAGYITNHSVEKNALQRMTDAIAHRGPDGEGHYYADNFAFGHRRLAIVDLSAAGKQPMPYADRYIITFNGEIYNYVELRSELTEKGYKFHSDTDTEVIMAAYDCWGVDCLNKFNGMWAFVLFDKETNKFFISRDRFGKKPLYYYKDNEKFVFCSEVKGIYASGLVERKPNLIYLKQYLENGPNEYDAPTAFENIFRIPFAHYFLGTKDDLISGEEFIRFWKIKINDSNERFDAGKAKIYAKQYYELLSDSVRLRLRSDVKLGSALSGGLDSSSIVYLVNQQLRTQGKEELQETFSSVYKSDGTQYCDESIYIDLLAKELNVRSNQIEPNEADIPTEHAQMILAMENPPESTCMSGWHTFMKVKQVGVKVTLDGQGADEQLAGYLPYISSYLSTISILDLYKEFFYFLKIPGIKKTLILSFIMANFKMLFGELLYKKIFRKLKGRAAPLPLNQELKKSFERGLVTLIHYADHTSMAHSIESRMPFMDYRLVEFLASVPACYKMHNGWTKYLARLAFDGKLPDSICWRKEKMGWPIPEDYWFNGVHKGWIQEQVRSSTLLPLLEGKIKTEFVLSNGSKKEGMLQIIRRLNISKYGNIFFFNGTQGKD